MIDKISYRGWDDAYRIANDTVQLTVLANVGPRIISYDFVEGEKILHGVAADAVLK